VSHFSAAYIHQNAHKTNYSVCMCVWNGAWGHVVLNKGEWGRLTNFDLFLLLISQ
jgi:hypothetical protein